MSLRHAVNAIHWANRVTAVDLSTFLTQPQATTPALPSSHTHTTARPTLTWILCIPRPPTLPGHMPSGCHHAPYWRGSSATGSYLAATGQIPVSFLAAANPPNCQTAAIHIHRLAANTHLALDAFEHRDAGQGIPYASQPRGSTEHIPAPHAYVFDMPANCMLPCVGVHSVTCGASHQLWRQPSAHRALPRFSCDHHLKQTQAPPLSSCSQHFPIPAGVEYRWETLLHHLLYKLHRPQWPTWRVASGCDACAPGGDVYMAPGFTGNIREPVSQLVELAGDMQERGATNQRTGELLHPTDVNEQFWA